MMVLVITRGVLRSAVRCVFAGDMTGGLYANSIALSAVDGEWLARWCFLLTYLDVSAH